MLQLFRDLLRTGRQCSPALAARSLRDACRVQRLEQQIKLLRLDCRRAEQRERERIACCLHDDLGQLLILMRIQMGRLRAQGREAPEDVHGDMPRALEALGQLVKEAAETTRALTSELGASMVAADLRPALQGIAQEMTRRYGLTVDLRVPHKTVCLPEPQHSVVYRTVREFCFNAQKHAQATRLLIESRIKSGQLWIDVQDNGAGMKLPAQAVWRPRADGGFGLASAQAQLRALGGDLHVRPLPGRGTRASLRIPLDAV